MFRSKRTAISSACALALAGGVASWAAAGASAHRSHTASGTLTHVSVQLEWLPDAEATGEYVAVAKGFYKDAGLSVKLRPGGPNLTPTSIVASGAATFGDGPAPFDILTAAANGIKLENVAITQETDVTRLVTAKKTGITSLKQLAGKTVGVWPGTSGDEMQALVAAAGGDPAKVHWVSQGNSLAPIISGSWGAGSATTYNELNLLKEQHVPIRVFNPQTYGIGFPWGGIATTPSYAAAHPKIVEAFLTATFRGWKYAFKHKAYAVGIVLKQGTGLTKHHQLDLLTSYQATLCGGDAAKHGMGYVDPGITGKALAFLAKYKLVKNLPRTVPATAWTDRFINAVPLSDRSCG